MASCEKRGLEQAVGAGCACETSRDPMGRPILVGSLGTSLSMVPTCSLLAPAAQPWLVPGCWC